MKYRKLFERYEGKVRGNKWYRMTCPFHQESDASLDVDLTKSGYHCWGCGKTGNHKDLIMKLDKVSESTAENIISRFVGKHIPSGSLFNVETEKFSYLDEQNTLELFVPISHPDFKSYLKGRKISVDLANKYDFRQGSSIERGWNDRLIYPIRDLYGNLCSIEGRTIVGHNLRYKKWTGSKSTLGVFGIENIPEKDWGNPLIIVEGAIDALSCISVGYMSVGMSCSEITPRQMSQIKRVTKYPVVLLDGVKLGTEKARKEVLIRIQKTFSKKFNDYKVIEIPYKNTDPNDLLRKGSLRKYLRSIFKDGAKRTGQSKRAITKRS